MSFRFDQVSGFTRQLWWRGARELKVCQNGEQSQEMHSQSLGRSTWRPKNSFWFLLFSFPTAILSTLLLFPTYIGVYHFFSISLATALAYPLDSSSCQCLTCITSLLASTLTKSSLTQAHYQAIYPWHNSQSQLSSLQPLVSSHWNSLLIWMIAMKILVPLPTCVTSSTTAFSDDCSTSATLASSLVLKHGNSFCLRLMKLFILPGMLFLWLSNWSLLLTFQISDQIVTSSKKTSLSLLFEVLLPRVPELCSGFSI